MESRFTDLVKVICKLLLRMELGDDELALLSKERNVQFILEKCLDKEYFIHKIRSYRKYPSDIAFQRFLATAGQKPRKRGLPVLWKVAACLAGISVLLVWLYTHSEDPFREPFDYLQNQGSVLDSGQGYISLRLADGSTRYLVGDTAIIDPISEIRYEYRNGRLNYRCEGNAVESGYNELYVSRAATCSVTLSDSTEVFLDSGSGLRYPVNFVKKKRDIYLEGEAFFEVAKRVEPFVVHTVLGEVQVLGTVFNVKAYKDENCVYTTLVEGKVRYKGTDTCDLVPGEQVVADRSGRLFRHFVDVEDYVGWKDGIFSFKNLCLGQIMKNLSRWYGVTVVFSEPALASITFTGNLKRYDDVQNFLNLLQRTAIVKYKKVDDVIVIYGNKKDSIGR